MKKEQLTQQSQASRQRRQNYYTQNATNPETPSTVEVAEMMRGLYEAIGSALAVTTETADDTKALESFIDAYGQFIEEITPGTHIKDMERKFKALVRLHLDLMQRLKAGTVKVLVLGVQG